MQLPLLSISCLGFVNFNLDMPGFWLGMVAETPEVHVHYVLHLWADQRSGRSAAQSACYTQIFIESPLSSKVQVGGKKIHVKISWRLALHCEDVSPLMHGFLQNFHFTWGFYSTFAFVRGIYGSIKIDWARDRPQTTRCLTWLGCGIPQQDAAMPLVEAELQSSAVGGTDDFQQQKTSQQKRPGFVTILRQV